MLIMVKLIEETRLRGYTSTTGTTAGTRVERFHITSGGSSMMESTVGSAGGSSLGNSVPLLSSMQM